MRHLTPRPDGPDASLRRHVLRTLKLATPVVMSRVGMMGLAAMDVVVLGRAGAEALADYVLATALYESLFATMAGLLLGVPVLTARAFGAGDLSSLGPIWRQGLIYGLLVGTGLCVLLQFAEPMLLWTGQSPEIAARSGVVTGVLALALPAIALFLVSATFLESIQRPSVGMVTVLLANLSNLAFNIVFVFGWGPIPALGAIGCAIATVLNAALLAAGVGLYVRFGLKDRVALGLAGRAGGGWAAAAPLRRTGYSAGLSSGLEAGAFSVVTLLVGMLGALALAMHGVLFQFLLLPFMVAFGIAAATQVRVGNAWGRGDARGLWLAGWIGLALASLVTGSAAIFYVVMPETLVRVFTTDPTVIAGAAPMMGWAALALMFDGGQSVMNHACRGRGDTWVPTSFHVVSYWLILIPAAALLTFPGGQGLAGVYQAIALASVVSLVAMATRFALIARRPLDPKV
ncbi:MATE family efflux transporter [Roseospira visakhapatnamensis]|uniref:MATE family multidrug resistance protein n=1 Tax=Roseospira visakhapatnamensis TaxID=390880 RepID=A0A7W6RDD4_9PROT|nr:MATE family efflux transporter [Roseospira visakhapatnamensis]MBB4266247.1 MATE family multidrug resistance protein [Roseospira visakhapatnamensis]